MASVPGSLSGITTDMQGTGPGFTSSGHTHSVDITGTPITVSTTSVNAQGTGVGLALADHTHALVIADTSGTPATVSGATVNTQGAGPGVSLNSHTHALDSSGVPATVSSTSSNTQGAGPGVSLVNHNHLLFKFFGGLQQKPNATITVNQKGFITAVADNIVFSSTASTATVTIPNGPSTVKIAETVATTTNTRVMIDTTLHIRNNSTFIQRPVTITCIRDPLGTPVQINSAITFGVETLQQSTCLAAPVFYDTTASLGAHAYAIYASTVVDPFSAATVQSLATTIIVMQQ